MENPFVISGIIPEQFFCGRDKEMSQLTKMLDNRSNILLSSPRRMGKTQLIYHLYERPEIKERYFTFYTDIYPTTCLNELVLFLSKEIYSVLVPRGKTALDLFLSCLRSLSGSFSYDPISGVPSFDVKLGDILSPALTLEEIFGYLQKAGKPCIFTIDEFQQIAYYPENNVEALLRSHIQKMNNCRFIFAGSNRHILENMFNSASRPFYNSTRQMYMDRIPKDIYTEFAIRKSKEAGKTMLPDAVSIAYDMFEGHTYYVHYLLHIAFSNAEVDKPIDEDDIQNALFDIMDEKGFVFSGMMNRLNFQQKETIVAIAREHAARRVTSVPFVRKHSLKSPSSVQYAIRTLLESQLITYKDEGKVKVYSVSDRFFEEWIRRTY